MTHIEGRRMLEIIFFFISLSSSLWVVNSIAAHVEYYGYTQVVTLQ